MKKAKLTKQGAKRSCYPQLEGAIVEYDELTFNKCAKNVYYNGKRIATFVSTTGDEKGLELLP
jgi:hypothetical protein